MIWKITGNPLPGHLSHIESPPTQLFLRATSQQRFGQLMQRPRVAIVGTRMITPYGQEVTARFAQQLAARGVVIISGLALGIDSVAHRAALEARGDTIAVLPTPVEQIYPRSHHSLAMQIMDNGGACVSEYPAGAPLFKTNFIARNRIVAGLADALLITEAAEDSGTMHTATFALRQGLTVLAVPGNINSPTSAGTNNLLKNKAIPVTAVQDIFDILHISADSDTEPKTARIRGANQTEQAIISLLEQGTTDGSELFRQSQLSIEIFNHHMTMLEITAKIRPLGNNHWGLA